MTPEEILRALLLASQAVAAAKDAYRQIRAVAAAGGVTEELLAEADARFAEIRPDPLGRVS